MAPDPAAITDALLAQRRQFKGFLTARLGGDETAAEDLLQNSLVKAIHRADDLRDSTHLTAWFYQLLRRAIVDHLRSRQATRAREAAWVELESAAALGDERAVCRCFESLLPTLKPRHAMLLHLVELDGTSVLAAAVALGVTANHASVLLHRARAELRAALEAFCGACSDTACLDCTCEKSSA
jgi:RNA polymerase sigma-70 factor (ECF subfamily)